MFLLKTRHFTGKFNQQSMRFVVRVCVRVPCTYTWLHLRVCVYTSRPTRSVIGKCPRYPLRSGYGQISVIVCGYRTPAATGRRYLLPRLSDSYCCLMISASTTQVKYNSINIMTFVHFLCSNYVGMFPHDVFLHA